MVRKPTASASKNIDKTLMPENPSMEKAEPQPSHGNAKSLGAVDSQVENLHPRVSPLKHPNFSVDGVVTPHETTPAQQQLNKEYELQKKSTTLKKKKSKGHGSSVRRSERIKSAIILPSNSNHGIECIEKITVSDSEKDEPATQLEKVFPELEAELEPEHESEPEESLDGKSLDEKVDYALQRIEALDKILKLSKSKQDDEDTGLFEAPPTASINYRSLYISSQKKLKILTDENQKLTGKLENALGNIKVYEKENRVMMEVLDKLKDAVNAAVVSNLARTTEVAVNASTQAIHASTQAIRNASSVSAAAKRKRNAQES